MSPSHIVVQLRFASVSGAKAKVTPAAKRQAAPMGIRNVRSESDTAELSYATPKFQSTF
ncbi:hypothetical protein D3C76_1873020 [compost metagenome]